ncbi:recombination mediator RecR [Aquibaculum arenosum]|uniref:Recombination protein RecR n=1 Tax=Aquibaculum arenosum TaxID=3032591 RepID=A0ABT5YHV5_9PROT|nr:recombination mediator RecR [Fodinicurvata sp. CAU 1616]MDF2094520.1 recombination mediator RecR [Fodinicurvata sp. CAU 1616]
MAPSEIDRLIQQLARLPGLGPRSARRTALYLLQRREQSLLPLAEALSRAAERIRPCHVCGNLDDSDPCRICRDRERDLSALCVVEEVGDLWALERSGAFKGHYHVLGGCLSALDGRGPEQLNLDSLWQRARDPAVKEIVLALSATVDGQTTAHYLAERLAGLPVQVTRLGQGVPVGGDLDYLDDGTLLAAFSARRPA